MAGKMDAKACASKYSSALQAFRKAQRSVDDAIAQQQQVRALIDEVKECNPRSVEMVEARIREAANEERFAERTWSVAQSSQLEPKKMDASAQARLTKLNKDKAELKALAPTTETPAALQASFEDVREWIAYVAVDEPRDYKNLAASMIPPMHQMFAEWTELPKAEQLVTDARKWWNGKASTVDNRHVPDTSVDRIQFVHDLFDHGTLQAAKRSRAVVAYFLEEQNPQVFVNGLIGVLQNNPKLDFANASATPGLKRTLAEWEQVPRAKELVKQTVQWWQGTFTQIDGKEVRRRNAKERAEFVDTLFTEDERKNAPMSHAIIIRLLDPALYVSGLMQWIADGELDRHADDTDKHPGLKQTLAEWKSIPEAKTLVEEARKWREHHSHEINGKKVPRNPPNLDNFTTELFAHGAVANAARSRVIVNKLLSGLEEFKGGSTRHIRQRERTSARRTNEQLRCTQGLQIQHTRPSTKRPNVKRLNAKCANANLQSAQRPIVQRRSAQRPIVQRQKGAQHQGAQRQKGAQRQGAQHQGAQRRSAQRQVASRKSQARQVAPHRAASRVLTSRKSQARQVASRQAAPRVLTSRRNAARKPAARSNILSASGAMRSPSGAMRGASGAMRGGSGAMRSPSGAMRGGSGAVRSPSGAVRSPSGAMRSPSGAMRGASGAMRGASGATRRKKDAVHAPTVRCSRRNSLRPTRVPELATARATARATPNRATPNRATPNRAIHHRPAVPKQKRLVLHRPRK